MSHSASHRERRRLRARVVAKRQRAAHTAPRGGKPHEYRQPPQFRSTVERLTNHQRKLWGRAGYPGAKEGDPEYINRSLLRATNIRAIRRVRGKIRNRD